MVTGKIDRGDVRLFAGSSNPELAGKIAEYLEIPLEKTHVSRFSNDNLYIQLGASVRSRKVYVVQSLSPPVNDHLMELLMMLDIARSASASEVHAIIPYYSFARSDKKDAPRISITARLVADLIQTAGATHVMTMMLHAPQVHGFFSVPTDPLSSRPVLQAQLSAEELQGTVVVTPDMGNVKSAMRFAEHLGLDVAAANKERITDTQVQITGIVGAPLSGFHRALVYDDEVATGGSILELSDLLVRYGIEEIWVACTHGVFVRDGLERLARHPYITRVIATDTVHVPNASAYPKLEIVSVARIFGEAIRRNYWQASIGDLFVFGEDEEE
ncbi:MAG: ribose-phosphate pyrophosphokinase [Anaerolineae bacterium]|nr:ribose-phosphate pyrophosphokinase [Anaerolineae bacterium]